MQAVNLRPGKEIAQDRELWIKGEKMMDDLADSPSASEIII